MNNFHQVLRILIAKDESIVDFDKQLEINIQSAIKHLNIKDNLENLIPDFQKFFDSSIRWKYISLAFSVLFSVKTDENLISINYLNDIKTIFQFITSLGVLPNLLPGVGINLNQRCKNFANISTENVSVENQYYRLTNTVRGLLFCLETSEFRNFILANHFNDLIAALLQICYAPVKKPSVNVSSTEFVMTESFYAEILRNREYFQKQLNNLIYESYPPKVVQELMYFYGNKNSPRWLKLSVNKILNNKLRTKDGVESLIKALIDFDTSNKYDILSKLLMQKPHNLDNDIYYSNICSQILNLLFKNDNYRKNSHYELIAAECVKILYEQDLKLCDKYFLTHIFQILIKYSKINNDDIKYGIITDEITKVITLLYFCFVDTSGASNLPFKLVTPLINILFYFLIILRKTIHVEITKNIINILLAYLTNADENNRIVFDSLLFNVNETSILQMNDKIEILVNKINDIEVRKSNVEIKINSLVRSECLLEIISENNSENITIPLCLYLLDVCSKIHDKKNDTNKDLLQLETDDLILLDENTERRLVAYHLLSNLISNTNVHSYLQKNPEMILQFIENLLKQMIIENQVHKTQNYDSESFQIMFLLIMIISIVVSDVNKNIFINFESLSNILRKISNETRNGELKTLISGICGEENVKTKSKTAESEYKKAMEDIFDPLLPIRGHGLMTLAKLIEAEDVEACSNKQYILNVSQQHLKDNDSYIYLNSIKVLAALGDSFPDIILNLLTEEFSNAPNDRLKKDNEVRMKLGEVLLRVVKTLGERAPKYKALLLNTFLSGVRDEDHLIRASSLSNLGELCRVLGYRLGSVVTEVLSCIHAVIATDKAVEARRAAVSVIRWLFVGLEKETIVFLKDEILPIYRTLKQIYNSDPDDITRLQAQLALEELNENVRDFIFPKQHLEKNIVMLH